MTATRDSDSFKSPLTLGGVALVLASSLAAVWMFTLGDIVTALGLGLLVVAGALLSSIGVSDRTVAH